MRKSSVKPNAPNRITEHRLAEKLSLKQLGAKIGTSDVSIHRLETGKTNLTVYWMNKLAAALGVHPSDLLPDHEASAKKPAMAQPVSNAGRLGEHFQMIDTKVASLERLGELLAKKVITKKQFETEKKRLLKG